MLLVLLIAAAPIQFYSATSGANVENLFDGKRETTWSAVGAGSREGVFVRFEKPVMVDKLRIVLCDGTASPSLYVNGSQGGYFGAAKGGDVEANVGAEVTTVFLRAADSAKKFCLGEVQFQKGSDPIALSRAKAVPATITASATLAPADAFAPAFIVDQRLDFGWAEPKGAGESITFDFSTGVTLSSLEIWNGYHRSKDHFAKNARAAKIELKNEKGETRAIAVKDAMEKLSLAVTPALSAKTLTLTVTEVYKGSKYPDLVISELRFIGPDGPFLPVTAHREERQTKQIADAKGTALDGFQDTLLKGACRPGETSILKLRSNLSLVSYASRTQTDEDATEQTKTEKIVEGAWIPKNIGPQRFDFDLYARRYVARERTEFYGEGSGKEETEGIVGGSHKVLLFGADTTGLDEALKELKKAAGDKAVACAKKRAKEGKIAIVLGPVWSNVYSY